MSDHELRQLATFTAFAQDGCDINLPDPGAAPG